MAEQLVEQGVDEAGGRRAGIARKRFERFATFLAYDVVALMFALIAAFGIAAEANRLFFAREFLSGNVTGLELRLMAYAALSFALVSWFAYNGHYRRRFPFWTETKLVLAAVAFAALAEGFLVFAAKGDTSRLWLVLSWSLAVPSLVAARALARAALMRAGRWLQPAVVLGGGSNADDVAQALGSEKRQGYRIDAVHPLASAAHALRSAATFEAKDAFFVRLAGPHEERMVVVAPQCGEMDDAELILNGLARRNIPCSFVPPLRGMAVQNIEIDHFEKRDVLLLTPTSNLARPLSQLVKRSLDLVVAGLGLAAVAPLFVLISFLVRRDGGPAIYRHERVGRYGRHFSCLKFRTMHADADRLLQELLAEDPEARAEWARTRKLKDDPRITAIGRFLRATSLDELPQLINVLRGEMSLVGPRPVVASELALYGEDAAYYLASRPGVTGLWQVSGRNDTTYEERVHLDAWYRRNWSVWQDLVILMKTPGAVLFQRGVY